MGFFGNAKETYIYLNGIRPKEKVCLGDGLFLVASSCNPEPNEIFKKCKNEIEIGISCIFLRSISSHFHIFADTPKQVAAKAWNAQWDAILLSALFGGEIGWNFQSDVPPENFSDAKDFHITNYALKGFGPGAIKTLTVKEHRWIETHYANAKSLMADDMFRSAVHSLFSYKWHSMPRAQLALLWSGIEGLFGVDHELSFRLSLYLAKYLSVKKTKQKEIFEDVKKLYSIRSKAVHGGNIKNPNESVEKSVTILRRLVIKCAERGELPNCTDLAP